MDHKHLTVLIHICLWTVFFSVFCKGSSSLYLCMIICVFLQLSITQIYNLWSISFIGLFNSSFIASLLIWQKRWCGIIWLWRFRLFDSILFLRDPIIFALVQIISPIGLARNFTWNSISYFNLLISEWDLFVPFFFWICETDIRFFLNPGTKYFF